MYSPDESFMLSTLFYENKLHKFIDRKIIVTTFFYYINTIPEINLFVKSYKNIMIHLYELKESNKISEIQTKTFNLLKKFKEYGLLHPYLFLYNKELIKSYKDKFKESFFVRKITSEKNSKNLLIYEDFINLTKLIEKKNYSKIINFLEIFFNETKIKKFYFGEHIDIS